MEKVGNDHGLWPNALEWEPRSLCLLVYCTSFFSLVTIFLDSFLNFFFPDLYYFLNT